MTFAARDDKAKFSRENLMQRIPRSINEFAGIGYMYKIIIGYSPTNWKFYGFLSV